MASRFPRLPLRELLASIDSGWSPRCETSPAGPDEWGVLKVSAVTWGTYRQEENKRLPSDLDPRPEVEVSAGDLLMSRANTQELVGRAVLVRETRPKLMMSDKLLRLRVNAQADVRFVLALLAAPDTREQIELAASGSSGSMKNISQDKLGNLIVPVPPLPEQRKIAAILSAVDEVIEKTEAVIESLQALKKAMMQELLTRGLPGRHTRFKQTEIGEVPEGWEIAPLSDVADIRDPNPSHRYPADENDGVPLIATGDFAGEDEYSYSKCQRVPQSTFEEQRERCRFDADDVVFARKGRIGFARRYGQVPKAFSHTLVVMKARETRLLPSFLLQTVRDPRLLQHIERTMNSNSGVPTLGIKQLSTMLVPLPSRGEQQRIASVLDGLGARIRAEEVPLLALHSTKSALMSVLLTGELRVTPDKDAA